MKIKTFVSQADAVRAGSNDWGHHSIELDVEKLSEAQREALASLMERHEHIDLPVALLDTLVSRINEEVAALAEAEAGRKRLAEEEQARRDRSVGRLQAAHKDNPNALVHCPAAMGTEMGPCRVCGKSFRAEDTWSPTVEVMQVAPDTLGVLAKDRAAKLNVEARAVAATRAADHEDACAAKRKAKDLAEKEWHNDFFNLASTLEQKERAADDLLGEKERNQIVRDWLFGGMEEIPRYTRREATDLDHDAYCPGQRFVAWNTRDAEELPAEEYKSLKAIRAAVEALVAASPYLADAEVTVREHVGECTGCGATLVVFGALVEFLTPAGNRCTREFSL